MVVEVFKTNVQEATDALEVVQLLRARFPAFQINFDLEDCDKILRVAGDNICSHEIRGMVEHHGFACAELSD